jgi:diaminopropionate ammonia-lyase
MARLWLKEANSKVDGTRPTRNPLAFHRKLPGYEPSPLVEVPELAGQLGLGRLWVKDESSRLGLPSFKILGASWGVYRALEDRFGPFGRWSGLEDLRKRLAPHLPLVLAAATDGNHGRAVARMARLLGLGASIFVPTGTARARIDAIESEGATCTVVKGTYDDAVARSARDASEACLVISDTSWEGYKDVPRWVIEGYSTIFFEIDDALAEMGTGSPDAVVIQIGVGALAAAAVRHYRRAGGPRPLMLGVEPERAACVLASVEAGELVTVPGPHDSIMAGLNCGTPSMVAWPDVSRGFDVYVAIEDRRAEDAMRLLADEGVVAGETGAAGLAGLLGALDDGAVQLGAEDGVVLLCTEGATDPAAYERIVGRAPG